MHKYSNEDHSFRRVSPHLSENHLSLFPLSDGARTLAHFLHSRSASGIKAKSSFSQDISWLVVRTFSKEYGVNPIRAE